MYCIFDICTLREDILKGVLQEADFAAGLAQVLRNEGPLDYRDPQAFLHPAAPVSRSATTLPSPAACCFARSPMRNRAHMLAVAAGIEAMPKEDAAYWLGMVMHRKYPQRVLMALRFLLIEPGT